jgi:hypothetical protein
MHWKGKAVDALPPPIVTQEIQIVDDRGHPLLLLSGKTGQPTIKFMDGDGQQGMAMALDAAGRPSVSLSNPDTAAPTATLEIDDKGAHVKFDRSGGASGYLFLNNAGESGIVLIDPEGVRRLEILAGPDGKASIERYGADGKALP